VAAKLFFSFPPPPLNLATSNSALKEKI